ncbi:MAG TPA: aspartate aminotransferase family protein [Dehalococcoidia bacterium]|nr:aspartate aminotransferase family protein [Dehalococcoidia bacterium]
MSMREVAVTDWVELEKQYFMPVFRRIPLMLVRGEGVRVWDDQGREYLDFVGGIAVNILGHCPPVVVEAITKQAATLMHTSSLFYTGPQLELAELLAKNSVMSKWFFQNSGAEAVEGAIKLARRYGKLHLGGAYEIITAWHSFHGRTLVTTAATGKTAAHEPYSPLPAGFTIVDFNDLEAVKRATTAQTCAVLIEPVQGEGGVYPADLDYLRGLRAWCDDRGILLVFDEVQTGLGRCGGLFAYQTYGVEPDVMALAKGLAGGFPIGAFGCKERAVAMGPGDHGSTFGGNPLACAAAVATLRYVIDNDVPGNARRVGDHLMGRLREIAARRPMVQDVRGRGLLIAVEFTEDIAGKVVEALMNEGLLVNLLAPNAIRLMPPLIITNAEADLAVAKIDKVLGEL